MRILLLSAYDAGSHRRWRQGLVEAFPEHDWHIEALAPRHFAWRVRGNPLWWSVARREVLEQDWDLVLATSSTDLSTLRGLVPKLATVPTVVYFHENQLVYPSRTRAGPDMNLVLLDVYTALAAGRVLFNSRWNLQSLCDGLDRQFARLPDLVPKGFVDLIRDRSAVLPVPLEAECFQRPQCRPGPLRVVWNHRWEHDKAPERFAGAVRGVDCEIYLLGQSFRDVPAAFEALRGDDRVKHYGFVESRAAYLELLRGADLVVSTALHEFQGLSVLEAVASGCRPLVPDRLAYRELYPERWRYRSFPDDPAREIAGLRKRLLDYAQDPAGLRAIVPPDVTGHGWPALRGAWQRELTRPS